MWKVGDYVLFAVALNHFKILNVCEFCSKRLQAKLINRKRTNKLVRLKIFGSLGDVIAASKTNRWHQNCGQKQETGFLCQLGDVWHRIKVICCPPSPKTWDVTSCLCVQPQNVTCHIFRAEDKTYHWTVWVALTSKLADFCLGIGGRNTLKSRKT